MAGGGLASGVALVAKAKNPATRLIGVEPDGAAAMTRAIVRALVVDVVLVADDEITSALKLVMSRAKQVIEPAAAAAIAALLTGKAGVRHGVDCVAVLTGGNIDLGRLKGML